jgi:hypothetical protein
MTNLIDSLLEQQNFSFDPNIDLRELDLDKEDAVITIDDGNVNISSSNELTSGNKHRLSLVLPYILNAIQNHNKPFKFILSIGDLLKKDYGNVPVLCFCKRKNVNGILIPNIDFFTGVIYVTLKDSMNDIEYSKKFNSSIFVGSSTGNFQNNTRVLYGKKCLESNRHTCIISNLCQADEQEWMNHYPYVSKLQSSAVQIKNQLKHKVVINIDGNTLCWSRLYWQMNSNSIPVYIEKNQEDIQLFDYIDSGQGYVSSTLDHSISTVDEILDAYTEEAVNEINNAGQEYCKVAFSEYLSDPKRFLQSIITEICNKML